MKILFQWFLRRLWKLVRDVLRKLHLVPTARRYEHLVKIVDKYKCRRIMEIGTWNGNHALRMLETAKKHWHPKQIEYYGFDLFEDIEDKQIEEEFSKKPPPYNKMKEKLEQTGTKIKLYKGDTMNTLPNVISDLPKMDFIFIDGGHSLKTVENDWNYSKELMHDKTFVIFDDYWDRDDAGCRRIVNSLDKKEFLVEILKPTDKFKKDWGTLRINFVKVMKRTRNKEKA